MNSNYTFFSYTILNTIVLKTIYLITKNRMQCRKKYLFTLTNELYLHQKSKYRNHKKSVHRVKFYESIFPTTSNHCLKASLKTPGNAFISLNII